MKVETLEITTFLAFRLRVLQNCKLSLTFPAPEFFSVDAEIFMVSIFDQGGSRKKYHYPRNDEL
jgi:hypothetical protein